METTLTVAKLRELLDLIDDQDADVTLETLEHILEELGGKTSGEYMEKYMDQIKEGMKKKKKFRQIANVLADVLTKLIEKKGGSRMLGLSSEPCGMNQGGRIPEQFSTPVRKVLEEVSFGPPEVLGSSGDEKSMYSADYDLLEYVPFHGSRSVKAFQKKVASLASKYCITDIKCGENPNWNVLTAKTYNPTKEREHLRSLWQSKVITDGEYKNGEKLLKDKLTKAERVAARKELRFGVWRWTPADVARGYIEDRLEKPVRLEDAMKSTGITKLDLVVWLKNKYAEVSNIVLWTRKNGKTYAKIPAVVESLREDIALKLAEGKFFKVAKRMLSIARNRGDVSAQERLYTLINSHLGHIATVVADLTVLKEFPECVTNEKKRQALDELRDEMAKLYYPEFLRAKDPTKLLPALERKLNEEAKKKLVELDFLPPRDVYAE